MYTPTILFYGKDKSRPYLYHGIQDAAHLSVFIKNFCDSEGYGEKNIALAARPENAYKESQYPSTNKVNYGIWARTRRLNLNTFEDNVMKDDMNVWVVSYIMPSCPLCEKFAPHWDRSQLYQSLRTRNVKFAFVDIFGKEGED